MDNLVVLIKLAIWKYQYKRHFGVKSEEDEVEILYLYYPETMEGIGKEVVEEVLRNKEKKGSGWKELIRSGRGYKVAIRKSLKKQLLEKYRGEELAGLNLSLAEVEKLIPIEKILQTYYKFN